MSFLVIESMHIVEIKLFGKQEAVQITVNIMSADVLAIHGVGVSTFWVMHLWIFYLILFYILFCSDMVRCKQPKCEINDWKKAVGAEQNCSRTQVNPIFLWVTWNLPVSYLTLKHWETHGCVVSTVATDALVLKHQAISIHNAD